MTFAWEKTGTNAALITWSLVWNWVLYHDASTFSPCLLIRLSWYGYGELATPIMSNDSFDRSRVYDPEFRGGYLLCGQRRAVSLQTQLTPARAVMGARGSWAGRAGKNQNSTQGWAHPFPPLATETIPTGQYLRKRCSRSMGAVLCKYGLLAGACLRIFGHQLVIR